MGNSGRRRVACPAFYFPEWLIIEKESSSTRLRRTREQQFTPGAIPATLRGSCRVWSLRRWGKRSSSWPRCRRWGDWFGRLRALSRRGQIGRSWRLGMFGRQRRIRCFSQHRRVSRQLRVRRRRGRARISDLRPFSSLPVWARRLHRRSGWEWEFRGLRLLQQSRW